jgi:hypothetical protein
MGNETAVLRVVEGRSLMKTSLRHLEAGGQFTGTGAAERPALLKREDLHDGNDEFFAVVATITNQRMSALGGQGGGSPEGVEVG